MICIIIAFVSGEIILKRDDVDVNPQYTDSIDLELFVVHLFFSKDNYSNSGVYNNSNISNGNDSIHNSRFSSPYYKPGKVAFEAGLDEVNLDDVPQRIS
jgi:hypothetical protein